MHGATIKVNVGDMFHI